MKTPEDQPSFEAEITSISFVDVDEIMILTGGLKARIHQANTSSFTQYGKMAMQFRATKLAKKMYVGSSLIET